MKESTASSAENKNTAHYDRLAEYEGGTVGYSVIEGSIENNPIFIVPGFTEGRFVLKDFAETLNRLGGREVIFPDQPKIDKKAKLSIVDSHAEAMLAIIENEGFAELPVDIIAHSFGAIVAVKAAELAKDRGITSFDSRTGSHSVFIAPAGSNDKENLVYLGARWAKFVKREANPVPLINGLTKELDPTGQMGKAGQKNALDDLGKTITEVLELSKKERIYGSLGKVGLKPLVFSYAQDVLYPHKVIGGVLERNGDVLEGYSTPVDTASVGAASYDIFKEKSGLSGKEAKKAWAHHYRNAGHNDWLFHPDRTVSAILQALDGPDRRLESLRQAAAKD